MPASSSALVTSSGITGAAAGRRLAIRSTREGLGYAVRIRLPPCSCTSFATLNAIDWSVIMPVTRMFLPSSSPAMMFNSPCNREDVCSVAHAEAAVDGDDRAGDVARRVAGEEGADAGDLVGGGEPARRDRLEDLRLARLGQRCGHVGVDEAG